MSYQNRELLKILIDIVILKKGFIYRKVQNYKERIYKLYNKCVTNVNKN